MHTRLPLRFQHDSLSGLRNLQAEVVPAVRSLMLEAASLNDSMAAGLRLLNALLAGRRTVECQTGLDQVRA